MSEFDLRLITKWCNAQVDEFGEEYRIARDLVISKVNTGYEIVNMMCKGENFCEGREVESQHIITKKSKPFLKSKVIFNKQAYVWMKQLLILLYTHRVL
jgi:hypothetical protein